MNDMCFCYQCHQYARRWATITVDDVPHHYCEACWQKQRETFLKNLAAGDPRARRILDIVTKAVHKGKK